MIDFKTYDKTRVIKTVKYQNSDREIAQQRRKENSAMEPYSYGNPMYYKGSTAMQLGKTVFLILGAVLGQLTSMWINEP